MPYVAPAAVASGAVISKTTFGDVVIADLNFLANPPACRVFHGTTQSIADNTATALLFNSERFDTDSMHSTVTNTSRITFTTAGLYVVTLTFQFNFGTALTWAEGRIRLNGTTDLATQSVPGSPAGFAQFITVTTTYKFAAGNFVEAMAFQDNVGNTPVNVLAAGNSTPEFSAVWVGLG